MVRPILQHPHPALKTPAQPITEFGPELKSLVADMIETMYAAGGVGLAANQIGKSLHVFVLDTEQGKDESGSIVSTARAYLNCKILSSAGEMLGPEGCLSIAGVFSELKRSKTIQIEYQDLEGNTHTETVGTEPGQELYSRAIQHELDHLAGKLFIERLSPLKREMALKKAKRLSV
jgi:peptide deformylase